MAHNSAMERLEARVTVQEQRIEELEDTVAALTLSLRVSCVRSACCVA